MNLKEHVKKLMEFRGPTKYVRASAAEAKQAHMDCHGCGKRQPWNVKRWLSQETCECGSDGFSFPYDSQEFQIRGDKRPYVVKRVNR